MLYIISKQCAHDPSEVVAGQSDYIPDMLPNKHARPGWPTKQRSEDFLVKNAFLTCSWRFLQSNKLEQFKFKLEKIIGIWKHAGKVRNGIFSQNCSDLQGETLFCKFSAFFRIFKRFSRSLTVN